VHCHSEPVEEYGAEAFHQTSKSSAWHPSVRKAKAPRYRKAML